MADWTLAVEAVPPQLSALAVEDERCAPIGDAELVDGDVDALTRSFTALVGRRDSFPEHLLMVIPGDVSPQRFAALADAAGLAGLPDPSWLPDAVACAGETLAGWAPGTRAVVIDARTGDVSAWPVRTADDGIQIAATGALDISARLDALLAGIVQAKLSLAVPEFAEAVRCREDAQARRDAAHLSRELRRARRLLSETDGDELVVTAGGAEVSVGSAEFAHLVEHAVHDVLGDIREDAGTPVLIIAGDATPIVELLVAATGGMPLNAGRRPALLGAAALVRPREPLPDEHVLPVPRAPEDLEDPEDPVAATPAPGPEAPAPAAPRPAAPRPAAPRPAARPPRWAVPALSTLLVLAMSGAVAVLVVGPPRVAVIVPVFSEQVGLPFGSGQN